VKAVGLRIQVVRAELISSTGVSIFFSSLAGHSCLSDGQGMYLQKEGNIYTLQTQYIQNLELEGFLLLF